MYLTTSMSKIRLPYLQKIDFTTPGLTNKKECMTALYVTKGKVLRGKLQISAHLFGHQVHLSMVQIPIATSP